MNGARFTIIDNQTGLVYSGVEGMLSSDGTGSTHEGVPKSERDEYTVVSGLSIIGCDTTGEHRFSRCAAPYESHLCEICNEPYAPTHQKAGLRT